MSTPNYSASARFFPSVARLLALITAATFAAASAKAASQTFTFKYASPVAGGTAVATGTFTIEDTRLVYPVSRNEPITSPTAIITSIDMVVSGTAGGNGHFTTADYGSYVMAVPLPLDLTKEWVGQPQGGTFWGPGGTGDLNFIRISGKTAPNGVSAFSLQAFSGEYMVLVSVVGGTPTDALVGDAVDGLPGVTVASVRPGAIDESGFLYYHGKLTGPGVASTNSESLLKAVSKAGVPATVVLAREGASLAGGTIKTFGDPVVHAGKLCVKVQLVSGVNGVTTANDDVLAYGSTAGGNLAVIAREGASVPQPVGFHYSRFDWFHVTPTGVFFGATLADSSAKPASAPACGSTTAQRCCRLPWSAER